MRVSWVISLKTATEPYDIIREIVRRFKKARNRKKVLVSPLWTIGN